VSASRWDRFGIERLIRRRSFWFVVICSLALSACQSIAAATQADQQARPSLTTTPKITLSPSQTTVPTRTTQPEDNPDRSRLDRQEQNPPPTNTATPVSRWRWNDPGQVSAPILLYHHISDEVQDSRYYVSTKNFKAQMQRLQELGYTAIPLSLLLEGLLNGADLPPRPVVITFDDGPVEIYEEAFPIMQEVGYPGAVFVVANRLESEGFLNVNQLSELIDAGWEVGSHGMTHADITLAHSSARNEILQSRLDLNRSLGITVTVFAYPFGKIDPYVGKKVYEYGYRAAVGLGKSWQHSLATLYYLDRIEIHGDFSLVEFEAKLPWIESTVRPPQNTPLGTD
jgi:peptidoglycan/xylan/chitin deacetylase (PgdA/CDA1 family)